MGYCSDCACFNTWICKNYDSDTEEPNEDCWSKQPIEKVED